MRRRLDILEQNTSKDGELVRFRILRLHAAHAGVGLRFLPSVFERHRQNISFFFLKERTLYWMVALNLVAEARGSVLQFVSDPLPDRTPLGEVLALLPAADVRVQAFFDLPFGLPIEEKLRRRELHLFLKVAAPGGPPALKLLDAALSLRDALRDSTFYEFPELFVLPYHSRQAVAERLGALGVERLNRA